MQTLIGYMGLFRELLTTLCGKVVCTEAKLVRTNETSLLLREIHKLMLDFFLMSLV